MAHRKGSLLGEIRVSNRLDGDIYWSSYMSDLLEEVVQDWVVLVERGTVKRFANDRDKPITAEHLRVAKGLLRDLRPARRLSDVK